METRGKIESNSELLVSSARPVMNCNWSLKDLRRPSRVVGSPLAADGTGRLALHLIDLFLWSNSWSYPVWLPAESCTYSSRKGSSCLISAHRRNTTHEITAPHSPFTAFTNFQIIFGTFQRLFLCDVFKKIFERSEIIWDSFWEGVYLLGWKLSPVVFRNVS